MLKSSRCVSMRKDHRLNPISILCAWSHTDEKRQHFLSKHMTNNKWKGRLEYLNRGDPFHQDVKAKEEAPVEKQKDKKKHLYNNTRAYIWGNGENGALGQKGFLHPDSKKEVLFKMRRPFISSLGNYFELKTAACGYGFTLFATNDKEKPLFGTGLNDSGQIGYHRWLNKEGKAYGKPLEMLIVPSPINVPLLKGEKVKAVSAGRVHSLILTSSGRVFSMGNNGYGQCGRPIIENEDYIKVQEVHLLEMEGISKIACGQDHSFFLTDKGELFSCGWGADGQTGLGHYNNSGELAKVKGDLDGEKIVKVASAADCVLALNDKGEVFGWGNSEYGQFSSITEEQQICHPTHLKLEGVGKVKDIASGGTVCMVLTEDGEVFVWGYGILGVGPTLDMAAKPTAIPEVLFGKNSFSPDSSVESIHCGLGHQAAITSTGDLYIWGKNRSGCLGLNTDDDRYFPLKVAIGAKVKEVCMGVDHTVAVAKSWN